MPEGLKGFALLFVFVCLVAGGLLTDWGSPGASERSPNATTQARAQPSTDTITLTCKADGKRGKLTLVLRQPNSGTIWNVAKATFASPSENTLTLAMFSGRERVYSTTAYPGTHRVPRLSVYDRKKPHRITCS